MWVMYGWMDNLWLREHLRCQLPICFFPQGLLRRGLGLDCKWPALLQVCLTILQICKNINNGLHYFLNTVVIAKKAFLNCQYQPWRSTRPAGAAIVNPEHCPRQDLQVFVIFVILPNQPVCLLFVYCPSQDLQVVRHMYTLVYSKEGLIQNFSINSWITFEIFGVKLKALNHLQK